MFDELIDTSASRSIAACEQMRRMDGMVARSSRYSHTDQSIALLVDSLSRIEKDGTINMQAAGQALTQANKLLANGLLGADVAKTTRSLNSIANSVMLMTGYGGRIKQGIAGISGGNPQSIINNVGAGISSSVTSTGQILDSVQRAFNAAFNPDQAEDTIESTALLPIDLLNGFGSGLPDAGASHAHLLVLTAQSGESYYFNLSTAGYDTLRRQTNYNVASQDRLTRRSALQAVSKGGESITLSGAIFTGKSGAGQIERLRNIGYSMMPLNLTTGYGETLGQWYLNRIEEEQSGLFTDGMPRKQQFTLEFQRYGEDYQNV